MIGEKNAVKRAALVLNGGGIPAEILADCIVCADGGYNALRLRGIVPDAVVGDMDSIEPAALSEAEGRGVSLIKYSADKNETDGELALLYLKKMKFCSVDIYGAFGGRPDHAAANLSLLIAARKMGLNARIVDTECAVYYIDARDGGEIALNGKGGEFASNGEFEISDETGNAKAAAGSCNEKKRGEFTRMVSIIPRTVMRFESSFGLKYDLSGLVIKPGSCRGVSNVAAKNFGFRLKSGSGYVYVFK